MANETRRFHLTTLDQSTDARSVNDYKFSAADRRLLDRLLAYAVERHRHTGEIPASTPPPAPTVTMAAVGGMLRPNSAVYYRYGLVDPQGQERAGSAVTVAHTATQISTPPVLPNFLIPISGLLPPGVYRYCVSASTDYTSAHETLVSPPLTGETVALDGGFRITMPPLPAGATGWNIYCQGPTDLEPYFLAATTSETYDHDGTDVNDPHRRVPTANTTASASAATVTVDAIPTGWTCKLYRTYDAADWSNSVVDWFTTSPTVDTGHATRAGSPPAATASVGSPPKIRFTDGAEVQGTLPPGRMTVPIQVLFTQPGPVLVGRLPFAWVNEYDRAWVTSIRVSVGRSELFLGEDALIAVQLEYLSAHDSMHAWLPTTYGAATLVSVPIGTHTTAAPFHPLTPGDALGVQITNGGTGSGADSDLVVAVSLNVEYGSTNQSYEWET